MSNKKFTCDSCQSAPSTVYCRADSAYLCAGCDAEVHSANLISHRHIRTPIGLGGDGGDEEAAAWGFLDDPFKSGSQSSAGYLLGGEVDEYMGLMEDYTSGGNLKVMEEDRLGQELQQTGYGRNELVVPVQSVVASGQQRSCYHMEMEYEVSSAGFCYTPSLSHGVSLSSMETSSIVPDTAATNIFSGPPPQVPTQFSPMDKQARVLRYREKKKTRKFDKRVRYASRKAYAEQRPRIKGRFARRSETELQVDQMFSDYEISQGSYYSIVPSFDC